MHKTRAARSSILLCLQSESMLTLPRGKPLITRVAVWKQLRLNQSFGNNVHGKQPGARDPILVGKQTWRAEYTLYINPRYCFTVTIKKYVTKTRHVESNGEMK
jgi:hypothetical protein